jgi:hypothetical protein
MQGMMSAARAMHCALPRATTVAVRLYDLQGRMVWRFEQNMAAGYHSIRMPFAAMSHGRYVAFFAADGRVMKQAFTLAR